jgi:hypothetical protein
MIAASQQELVRITTSGEVSWIPIDPNNTAGNYGATWSKIALPIPLPSVLSEGSNPTVTMNATTRASVSATSTHTGTVPASSTSSSFAVRGSDVSLLLSIFIAGLGLCGHWSLL